MRVWNKSENCTVIETYRFRFLKLWNMRMTSKLNLNVRNHPMFLEKKTRWNRNAEIETKYNTAKVDKNSKIDSGAQKEFIATGLKQYIQKNSVE